MDLIGSYRAALNEDFRSRVIAAIVITANDIVNDDNISEDQPRKINAREVLRNPVHHPWVEQFAWRVAVNDAVAKSVNATGRVGASDNDIVYVISGAWNSIFPDLKPPTA